MISVDNRLQTVGILLDVLREIDHIDSSRKQYYLHSRQLDKDDNIMESANTRPINNQEREREGLDNLSSNFTKKEIYARHLAPSYSTTHKKQA